MRLYIIEVLLAVLNKGLFSRPPGGQRGGHRWPLVPPGHRRPGHLRFSRSPPLGGGGAQLLRKKMASSPEKEHGFMGVISIVNGIYKPTCNWGGTKKHGDFLVFTEHLDEH